MLVLAPHLLIQNVLLGSLEHRSIVTSLICLLRVTKHSELVQLLESTLWLLVHLLTNWSLLLTNNPFLLLR